MNFRSAEQAAAQIGTECRIQLSFPFRECHRGALDRGDVHAREMLTKTALLRPNHSPAGGTIALSSAPRRSQGRTPTERHPLLLVPARAIGASGAGHARSACVRICRDGRPIHQPRAHSSPELAHIADSNLDQTSVFASTRRFEINLLALKYALEPSPWRIVRGIGSEKAKRLTNRFGRCVAVELLSGRIP